LGRLIVRGHGDRVIPSQKNRPRILARQHSPRRPPGCARTPPQAADGAGLIRQDRDRDHMPTDLTDASA
jgi:hypothetical protein